MRIIRIGRKHVAYVDDIDFRRVNSYKWYLTRNSTTGTLYCHTYSSPTKRTYMHNFVLREWSVDHVNGNGLDNTRDNLRVVTPTQNGQNRKKQTTPSTSIYKGVAKDINSGKPWRARITVNGKVINLGKFDSEIEAALAYDKAALQYFGEYARPNFV